MMNMSRSLLALLAACAVETGDEETLEESELVYCPDGLCDPGDPDPSTLKADLAPGPPAPTQCNWVYTNIPRVGWKLGLRVYNNGKAAAAATTARVRFRLWPDTITAPIEVAIPALEPGKSSHQYVMSSAGCWNSTWGCSVMVTADAKNVVAELNESNNAAEWHCAK